MSDQILAVQAIIVNPQGKVLLRKRVKDPDKGSWQLLAGHVEPGERLVEAVEKHIREKVGIDKVEKVEFTGHYYDDPNRHPGDFCIPFSFKVTVGNEVVPKNKYQEARWFSRDELKTLDFALDNKQSLVDIGLL